MTTTTITYAATAEDQEMMDRALRAQQPGLLDAITAAGGFLQGVGQAASGVGSLAGALAQPVARELTQAAAVAPPLARGASRVALGTLRGGLSATSHTARAASSALGRLAAMGMPVQARAERFREGINVADGFGRLMANQHIH